MGKNGNYGGPKLRDRLCQLIRQHQLDANLVKSYAVDFCGTKTLREATREQVEAFVIHLADWAEKDYEKLRKQVLCRDGWRCQVCGSRQNLQVHHKQLRSQQGSDDDLNLITLCSACHEGLHRSC